MKSDTTAAPRAQSLTPPMKKKKGYVDTVTDRTAQSRELDPADEAAIQEFIENADDETKVWFLAQTTENQLAYLDDPDKHQKVFGRRP